MPTVAEIERLEALIGRLTPLSTRQRGEVIAADDWNLLVGALIEVGRAALAAGHDETVPPHEHPDQVSIGWLDPRVRQMVTGGGLKDPAVDTEFIKLRRDLTTLVGRIDRVGDDVDQSRARLDEVSTNDLVRESALANLNRKVLGAEDGRADIADLRSTLRTLETEVGRAVDVGTRLENNGQPIDIPALVERVAAFEAVRDRLTQPNGELLDASALEVRLLALQTSLVTQDELTEAIDDVRTGPAGGGFDLETVLDAARLASRETANASVEALGTDLRADLTRRLGEIPPVVSAEVERATSALRDDVLTAARAEFEVAASAGDASVRADLSALIEERAGATSALIEQRLAGFPDLIGSQVAQQISTQLSAALVDVGGRLDEMQSNVARLEETTRANGAMIADVDTRLESARRADAAERAQLRVDMLDRIAEVERGIDPRIVSAVDDARSILRTDLEASVAASRRDLEVRLEQVAREAATTEIQVLSTSIRTDVQSIIRQEIDANLATVRADLASEISGLNQRVAGMVSNEVARATSNIPALVNAELETFRPEFTRIVDGRISRPPIG